MTILIIWGLRYILWIFSYISFHFPSLSLLFTSKTKMCKLHKIKFYIFFSFPLFFSPFIFISILLISLFLLFSLQAYLRLYTKKVIVIINENYKSA